MLRILGGNLLGEGKDSFPPTLIDIEMSKKDRKCGVG
jgi:hypothetical protein